MRRQNQSLGLQIALCIFTMLTVVLAVSTFTLYRRAEQAGWQVQTAEQESHRARLAVAQGLEENRELKRLLGFGPNEPLPAVQTQFAEDMQPYRGGLAAQDLYYRPVVRYLQETVNHHSAELLRAAEENQRLKDALAAREGVAAHRLEKANGLTVAAVRERRDAEHAAKQDLQRLADENRDLQQAVTRLHKSMDAARAEAEKEISAWEHKQRATLKELQQYKDQWNDLRRQQALVAQGTVRHVSYALNLAWIDLGYADALRALVPFDVYAPETVRLDPRKRKGQVEVTHVLEPHLAEVRLVTQKPNDPLLEGDKIRSTSWTPGR
jgi:hypothetical protein